MARPPNFKRPFHPFSPFNPICTFGDEEITRCQHEIYFMTGRIRTILLARLDGPHVEQRWEWWNIRFSVEINLANSLIGWATLAGVTLDIPYLLRSICIFAPFILAEYHLSVSPDMEQLLRNPPLPTSPAASQYLHRPPKYLQEWWTEGTEETEALTLEVLHTAHQLHLLFPPADPHPHRPSVAAHNAPSRESPHVAGLPTPVNPPCTKCTKSVDLARRAVVELKNCRLHMEASRQFCEWSASHSQRFSLGCKFLSEQPAKLGRPIAVDDLHELGGKDYPYASGVPLDRQTTTYPSEDGINWKLHPYEDTQGPLLSSGAAPGLQPFADGLDQPTTSRYEDCLGEDGFNVDAWSKSLPSAPGIIRGAARINAGVQVPPSTQDIGPPRSLPPVSADPVSPAVIITAPPEDVEMSTIQSPTPTEISSGGLSDRSTSASEERQTDTDNSMQSEEDGSI